MKHLVYLALLALMGSCAALSLGGSAAKNQAADKMALTNIVPFDLAACGPRAIELSPLNSEVLTGALLSLAPALSECLVDANSREGAAVDLKAKVTVNDVETKYEVVGTGATASAKTCLEDTLKTLALKPLERGAKVATAEVPIGPGAKTVIMGQNSASDVIGLVRLAQPSFCSCYDTFKNQSPPELKGTVTLSTSKPALLALDGPAEAADLKNCLAGKVSALNFAKVDVQTPLPILLTNSYASDATAGAPAPLQFQQLDGIRAQKTADVLISAGKRIVAAETYDALAKKYKAKPSKALLDDLRAKCKNVLAADDVWLGSLNSLTQVYDRTISLVTSEKAKDPQWAQVESALGQQLSATSSEVKRVEQFKVNDQNACPKMSLK